MTQDRNAAIRQDLVDAQHDLLEVLNRVGPDDWPRPSPNEGWTVRDLLIHLTTSESGFVGTLRHLAAGEGGVPAAFAPNRRDAREFGRRAGCPAAQLGGDL